MSGAVVRNRLQTSLAARRGRPALHGIFLFLLFMSALALPGTVSAQQMPPRQQIMPDDYVPEEYSLEEFPQWMWDVRRYEVIAVGAFPISFFATSLIYDYAVFGSHNFDPAYALGTQRSKNDIAIIAGTAAGVSLLVATADIIIELVQRNKRNKEHEQSEISGSAD